MPPVPVAFPAWSESGAPEFHRPGVSPGRPFRGQWRPPPPPGESKFLLWAVFDKATHSAILLYRQEVITMKTQIVIPDSLMDELKKAIPIRRRSQFIAEAVAERLRVLRLRNALKDSAGCWTNSKHPDLRTQQDINRFLSRFRSRLKRRG